MSSPRRWFLLFLAALALPAFLGAQSARYALVIGNGSYAELGKLKNPVNDATDVSAKLTSMGFQVELLRNADLTAMEESTARLGNRLATSRDAIGFFYYAGHGVQSNGSNYLVPVDAHIPSEAFLRSKALSAREVLDTVQNAGNNLNIVVLDACRDNPFGWARSGTRGLTVVGSQPRGSIVVYATGAGSVAIDGEGRNGLFTQELLKNLDAPGLDIKDVFNRTGSAVTRASSNRQVPAIYSQFFGSLSLTGQGKGAGSAARTPAAEQEDGPSFGVAVVKTGTLQVSVVTGGTLRFLGREVEVPAGSTIPITNVKPGSYEIHLAYPDGTDERQDVALGPGQTRQVSFTHAGTVAPQAVAAVAPPATVRDAPDGKNWLFPLDGVTLGRTTVRDLARLGTRTKELDSDTHKPLPVYIINGAKVWYDADTNLTDKYYLVSQTNPIPAKWAGLGMAYEKSYDEWMDLARRYGWKVEVTKAPVAENYNGHPSFRATAVLSYAADGNTYYLELYFAYGNGTGTGDRNTLYCITVTYAYTGKASAASQTAPQDGNWLFPLDGVTLGKTTVRELARLGTRTKTIDDSTHQPYLCYDIKAHNAWYRSSEVWYDEDTKLADHYYLNRSTDRIPAKWADLGMSYEKSYDEWMDLARRYGWKVEVTKAPVAENYNGHPSFRAEAVLSYVAEGYTYGMTLSFSYSTGTRTDDRNTLYMIGVNYSHP